MPAGSLFCAPGGSGTGAASAANARPLGSKNDAQIDAVHSARDARFTCLVHYHEHSAMNRTRANARGSEACAAERTLKHGQHKNSDSDLGLEEARDAGAR